MIALKKIQLTVDKDSMNAYLTVRNLLSSALCWQKRMNKKQQQYGMKSKNIKQVATFSVRNQAISTTVNKNN